MLENAGCAILVFANPEKTDVWVEDCSIVMSNMHLMADSLDLEAVGYREGCEKLRTEKVRKHIAVHY